MKNIIFAERHHLVKKKKIGELLLLFNQAQCIKKTGIETKNLSLLGGNFDTNLFSKVSLLFKRIGNCDLDRGAAVPILEQHRPICAVGPCSSTQPTAMNLCEHSECEQSLQSREDKKQFINTRRFNFLKI